MSSHTGKKESVSAGRFSFLYFSLDFYLHSEIYTYWLKLISIGAVGEL